MPDNTWEKVREPFENVGKWETEAGTRVKVGDEVLAKPKYLSIRLPAVVKRVYWNPTDFRKGDTANCILTALVEFQVSDDDEFSHLDGKQRKIEAYNLDFCIGTGREIRRDRENCNTDPIGDR